MDSDKKSDDTLKMVEGEKDSMADYKETNAPKDRYDAVFWFTYYTGLVILLPWNILITVNTYWDYKFRDTSLDGVETDPNDPPPLTKYQKEFTSYLSIASNVPNALFVILHALWGHRFNMSARLVVSQTGQILVFIGVLVLAALDSDDWQQTFLVLNLAVIALLNVFAAVFQASFSAALGPFPVKYLGTCVVGAGMGGLLPAVVNVGVLAIDGDPQWSGFWCFLFAEILAIMCLCLTVFMMRTNAFFKYYSYSLTQEEKEKEMLKEKPELEREKSAAYNLDSAKKDFAIYWEIVQEAWVYLLATFINFCTTLVVFPAVCTLVEPANPDSSDWSQLFFVPVCCFVVYNAGDVAGKWAAAWLKWPGPTRAGQWATLVAAVARIGIIPAIMRCNVAPGDRDTEIWFDSDAWYLFFNTLLAFSNGYVGNLCTMFGPKVVRPELQEMTAAFSIAALVLGIGIGSVISTPVVRLL